MQHQLVGHQILNRRIAEQYKRRAPELDHDVSVLRGQAFSRAQIKRNIGPSPVVNLQLHGDEGFSFGIGRNIVFFAIAGHVLPLDDSGRRTAREQSW